MTHQTPIRRRESRFPATPLVLPGATAAGRRTAALAPGLVYAGGQCLTVLVVAGVAAARHRLSGSLWWSWDGQHFLSIASHGYTNSVAAHVGSSPAFFPGYPALIAALAAVSRMPLPAAGIVISAVSGLVFAFGLHRLVTKVAGPDRGVGLLVVFLASVGPLSIVLSMVYSEALFCALAVWCLVAVVDQRWMTAGLLCVLAGTVRQTALALVVAIGVAAVAAARRRAANRRTWLAVAIAPLGLVGYLAWVAVNTGHVMGWFEAERNGWHTYVDFGAGTERFSFHALVFAPALLDVVTVAMVGLAVILLIAAAAGRAPAAMLAYSSVVLALDVFADGIMNSKVRLLVPAFTLLVPVSVWLRTQTPLARSTILGCTAVAGTWYSGYALVIYGHAI
jgi:Gpi18-like mannosyltransferase